MSELELLGVAACGALILGIPALAAWRERARAKRAAYRRLGVVAIGRAARHSATPPAPHIVPVKPIILDQDGTILIGVCEREDER